DAHLLINVSYPRRVVGFCNRQRRGEFVRRVDRGSSSRGDAHLVVVCSQHHKRLLRTGGPQPWSTVRIPDASGSLRRLRGGARGGKASPAMRRGGGIGGSGRSCLDRRLP